MAADEAARHSGVRRGTGAGGGASGGSVPGPWARRAALCLALAGLVTLSACGQSPAAGRGPAAGTPTAHSGATSTPQGTPAATASPQSTPANSPFVCANPAGSSLTYAFVNADHQVYTVTGCSAPVQLTHLQRPDVLSVPTPIAWSPSHRYLAIHPNLQHDACLKIYEVSTGAALARKYDCFNGDPSQSGDLRTFVGWLDDDTFLGRIDLDGSSVPDPVRLARVDIHTQAETPVKSYAWMSDPKLRGGYLFFGGRVTPADTTAYLYRLSPADGSQTRLVSLGLSGQGGCQVWPGPCSWTAPWDVSPDGTRLLYHNPGASTLPSDTQAVPDTPIYYASVDGSGAVRVLAGLGSPGLLGPAFDPTGARATTTVGNGHDTDLVYQALPGGAIERMASTYYVFWRGMARRSSMRRLPAMWATISLRRRRCTSSAARRASHWRQTRTSIYGPREAGSPLRARQADRRARHVSVLT